MSFTCVCRMDETGHILQFYGPEVRRSRNQRSLEGGGGDNEADNVTVIRDRLGTAGSPVVDIPLLSHY